MAVPQQGGDEEIVTLPHWTEPRATAKHPPPHHSTARLMALKKETTLSPFLSPFQRLAIAERYEHLISAMG